MAGGDPGAPSSSAGADGPFVSFTVSGGGARWDGTHRTLLEFAEAHGKSPPFSCRSGICSTCLTEIEGEVRYLEEPLDEPGPGFALLCCSQPVGPVKLKI